MLPFLKRKDSASTGLIVKDLSPTPEAEPEQDPSAAIEACARHLLLAIEAKDVKAIADALCDAFTILESQEGQNEGPPPHSYEAQNIIAGENS